MSFEIQSNYVYKQLTPDQVELLKRIDIPTVQPIVSQGLDAALNGILPPDYHLHAETIVLSPSDISTLNTTPVILVPAQGANKFVVPIQIVTQIIDAGIAWTTINDVAIFDTINSGTPMLPISSYLTSTSNTITKNVLNIIPSAANNALEVYAPTSNPTGGSSTLAFYIVYVVLDVL